ncbi:MAG: sugar transferase [Planctomycetota bacterium]
MSRDGALQRFVRGMGPGAWMAADWAVAGVAAAAACTLLTRAGPAYAWSAPAWLVTLTFCAGLTVAGLVFGLYERRTLLARSHILVRCALTVGLGVVLAFACLSLFFYSTASRWVGLAVALAYCGAAVPLRVFAHEVVTSRRVRLLCIGAGDSIRQLATHLGRVHRRHYEIIGHLEAEAPGSGFRVSSLEFQERETRNPKLETRNPKLLQLVGALAACARGPRFRSDAELEFIASCPCVGTLADLPGLLPEWVVDEVVVGSELTGDPAVGRAVALCLGQRCRVTDQATFVEKLLGEVPVENITAEWFLRADVQNRGNYEAVRRIMDAVVAALGLALTLPLWPLIALLVRLDSGGPALFRQVRVGLRGRRFTMYKFRTMRPDAEPDGARWAEENDERVTRIGRFLRRTRLDELPQLFNILRGDMSLVGPRPERPEFVRELERVLPHYRLRHLARPGLTGWAQINYRYGSSVADAHRKLCYDLYYLKHRSLELDVGILIRTLGTFLLGAR